MPIYFGSTPIASVKKAAETLSSLKVPSIANPGQLVETLLAPPDAPTNLTITVEEDYAAPSQVTGLAVDSTGDGTIDLSWTAPASEAAISDYSVEYTPSGGSATTVLVGSAATTYQLTGLTNDTEYSVRVAAASAGGTGAYSAAVTGTPVSVEAMSIQVVVVPGPSEERNRVEVLSPAAHWSKYRLTIVTPSLHAGAGSLINIGGGNQVERIFSTGGSNTYGPDHNFNMTIGRYNPAIAGTLFVEALDASNEVVAVSETVAFSIYDDDD